MNSNILFFFEPFCKVAKPSFFLCDQRVKPPTETETYEHKTCTPLALKMLHSFCFRCILLPVESIWQGARVRQRTLLLTGELLFDGEHVVVHDNGHHRWQEPGHDFEVLQAQRGGHREVKICTPPPMR